MGAPVPAVLRTANNSCWPKTAKPFLPQSLIRGTARGGGVGAAQELVRNPARLPEAAEEGAVDGGGVVTDRVLPPEEEAGGFINIVIDLIGGSVATLRPLRPIRF